MKVLVTGGTGFVGSALVRHLLAADYDVRVLVHYKRNKFLLEGLNVEIADGDVTCPAAVERAVKDCAVVFDVASIYTFFPFWEREARALYKVNVQGTVNLLTASLRNRVDRYIHTSSIATIGKRTDGRASDEETGFNFKTASHYARSKYMAEQEVLKFCRKGLAAIILNPGIVIGERDHKPTPSGDVIVKFLNRNYPVYFDTLWAVADADDVARAHIAAIKHGRVGQRYILCNERHYRLKDIFGILERVSATKAPRLKIPYPLLFCFVYLDEALSYFIFRKKPLLPSEGLRFCKMSTKYDNSKAVNELAYASSPIEETLAKATSWYRKNGYIEPRGIFRMKAHGSKAIKFLMRKLGMDKLTDKLNPATLAYYLIVRFLQFLQRLGLQPSQDGWRKVAECYLRTEHSKFALAAFGLNFMSGLKTEGGRTLAFARRHVIQRLADFLRQYPSTHCQLKWDRFSAKKDRKEFTDIVQAEFDSNGVLESIDPYFDSVGRGGSINDMPPKLRSALIEGIVANYNKTRNCDDKKRPLILKTELGKWLLRQPRLIPNGMVNLAKHFIERLLSATFVHFEKLPSAGFDQENGRFCVPSFIKCKHPGFGLLNIACRFGSDLNWVDLWVQFSHIPVDGVPAQEILNDLKKLWGERNVLALPTPIYEGGMLPDVCSTLNHRNGIYHIFRFVDFRPFLRLRRAINKRHVNEARGSVTAATLLIWKLAQFKEFEDIKFTIPVDLRATKYRERTLGFVFIRPSTYLDKDKPDRGFFNFQHEFNRQLRAVRKRKSESYNYLECLALAPPWMYSVTSKLMAGALREFGGTIGITIIKRAEFFIAPYSDVHRDGFIAFSNFSIPSVEGGRVGLVSIKGPKQKIQGYMNIINEIMNCTVRDDELYF